MRTKDPLSLIFFTLGKLLKALLSTPRKTNRTTSIQPRSQPHVQALSTAAPHRWPDLGEFAFEVVGESFYQPALQRIADDEPEVFEAVIRPIRDNPHDSMAVAVLHNGQTIGHLSRTDARSYRRRLAGLKLSNADGICKATLIGGYSQPGGDRAMFGVMLDLKPFE